TDRARVEGNAASVRRKTKSPAAYATLLLPENSCRPVRPCLLTGLIGGRILADFGSDVHHIARASSDKDHWHSLGAGTPCRLTALYTLATNATVGRVGRLIAIGSPMWELICHHQYCWGTIAADRSPWHSDGFVTDVAPLAGEPGLRFSTPQSRIVISRKAADARRVLRGTRADIVARS